MHYECQAENLRRVRDEVLGQSRREVLLWTPPTTCLRPAQERSQVTGVNEPQPDQPINPATGKKWTLYKACAEVMVEAKEAAGDICAARTLIYKVRPRIQDYTSVELDDHYFLTNILPRYQREAAQPNSSLTLRPRRVLTYEEEPVASVWRLTVLRHGAWGTRKCMSVRSHMTKLVFTGAAATAIAAAPVVGVVSGMSATSFANPPGCVDVNGTVTAPGVEGVAGPCGVAGTAPGVEGVAGPGGGVVGTAPGVEGVAGPGGVTGAAPGVGGSAGPGGVAGCVDAVGCLSIPAG